MEHQPQVRVRGLSRADSQPEEVSSRIYRPGRSGVIATKLGWVLNPAEGQIVEDVGYAHREPVSVGGGSFLPSEG